MTESQLQEVKKIDSAVKSIEYGQSIKDCNKGFIELSSETTNIVLSILRSYLHAMQSGVPEEESLYGLKEGGVISAFRGGFNSCRSLFLPLIVARDRNIEELEAKVKELEGGLR